MKKTIRMAAMALSALLCFATTTGAMAQEESLLTTLTFGGSSTYSETTSGVVSVTATNVTVYHAQYGWLWFFEGGSLSVTAEEGYTITKCVFRQNDKTPITDTEAPFEIHSTDEGKIAEDTNWDMNGVTSIEVYGYANAVAGYSVTMKDGTVDAAKWTAKAGEGDYQALPVSNVVAGTTVTVKYDGDREVKSVKAKKKAPAGPTAYTLAESTQGMIVGTDGKAYDVADKDNLPTGVTAAGMVAYKSGSNGLVIALADEASTMNWSTANGASGAAAHTPTVTGQAWKLPSQAEWKQMFKANGNNEGSYTGLNTTITTAGGDGLQEGEVVFYWSSTKNAEYNAQFVNLNGGNAGFSGAATGTPCRVRACLAF